MKSQPPADGQGGPAAQLLVEKIGDEQWSWRYLESASGITLHSNETFHSREAAVDSARKAYPDVALADDEE